MLFLLLLHDFFLSNSVLYKAAGTIKDFYVFPAGWTVSGLMVVCLPSSQLAATCRSLSPALFILLSLHCASALSPRPALTQLILLIHWLAGPPIAASPKLIREELISKKKHQQAARAISNRDPIQFHPSRRSIIRVAFAAFCLCACFFFLSPAFASFTSCSISASEKKKR